MLSTVGVVMSDSGMLSNVPCQPQPRLLLEKAPFPIEGQVERGEP
jgi:hypothetical protein